jgi:hypothetical protein
MSQSSQIRLSDAKEWLSSQTSSLIGPLKDKANDLLKEIKFRIDDTEQSGQRILQNSQSEMNKDNQKTYRFARNANRFAQNLTDAIKAVKVPENVSYGTLQTFCGDLEKTFGALEQLRRGAYPYISPYFIFDRRRLDVSYKRLYDITRDLRSFMTEKYEKAKTVEDAYSIVDRILQTIDEAKRNEENIERTKERETLLEGEIAQIQQKIVQTEAKTELNELLQANARIDDLRENVKHNLRYLQKPFFKLQSLARTSEVAVPLDEMTKIQDYLGDPFTALATEEEGYLALRSILRKLDSTITQRKMKLKSTRLRKAQDQIDSILNKDSLGQLQKNCRDALSRRNQLLASESTISFQNQLTEFQTRLKELQKENEFITSRTKALENERDKLRERTQNFGKELENKIQQSTNKKVQIVLPT